MVQWQLAIDGADAGRQALADLLEARGAQIEGDDGAARLVASFTAEPDLIIIDAVGAWLSNLGLRDAQVHTRRDEGAPWEPGFRAIFEPFVVSPRLGITPAWRPKPGGDQGRRWIILDPTQAFGGGAHPTTRAALGLIDRYFAERGDAPTRVLDVGSGSGVLAIAAALLGAEAVVGVELDPVACRDSVANAALSGVQDRFEAHAGSMERVEGRFDLVVANVYGSTLTALAPALRAACDPDLIISGMMASKADAVLASYQALTLVERVERDGWTTAWLRA
ncbi:MAG: hypothetical protein CSA66_03620 [Proteobacteria bacterium]|nr:MAG: hypothetical protein CSA66_03620 [Pseudomonadota bacterium]